MSFELLPIFAKSNGIDPVKPSSKSTSSRKTSQVLHPKTFLAREYISLFIVLCMAL